MMDQRLMILLFVPLFLQVLCSEIEKNVAAGDAYVFRKLLNLIDLGSSTSSKFVPGPNGEICILGQRDRHDRRYEMRDDHGWCCCGLCPAGSYAKKLCVCGPNGNPSELTDCDFVKWGIEYMDKANKCSQPYLCSSSCGNHQRKLADCSSLSDITCECVEGWFNPNSSESGAIPGECRRRPRCPAGQGQELQSVGETGEVSYTCQPCREGYYQRFNDSTATCQPHRVCQLKAGSTVTDSICLNDKLLVNLSSNATRETPSPESKEVNIGTTTEVMEVIRTPTVSPDINITQSTPICTKIPDCLPMYVTVLAYALSVILLLVLVCYCCYVNKHKYRTNNLAGVNYSRPGQQVRLPHH